MACVYGVEQPCGECGMCEKEERYTLEQIIDAITQADERVLFAIMYKDRDMLADTIRNSFV